MPNIKSYEYRLSSPSRESIAQIGVLMSANLAEMDELIRRLSYEHTHFDVTDRRRLLYIGTMLYDYYMLVEDCFLGVARTIDRWVPASLDWHYRLILLMKLPIPEKRPPVISLETACLLDDYLVLAINFHEHAPKLQANRLNRLIKNLLPLHAQLEAELTRFAGFL